MSGIALHKAAVQHGPGNVAGATERLNPFDAGYGLDARDLLAHASQQGTVSGYQKGEAISNAELLELDCEVLMPCALENQITVANAPGIRAKIIAEGANGPLTPEADEILQGKDVFIIPDILCNAGGVTVSYFEWVQDLQSFFWEEKEVNQRLERIMVNAFNQVAATAEERIVRMRQAAYIVSLQRVVDAMKMRGIYP
jgi:glutamate dehydrogenase (NAD(P)+)